jgi:hypothetical protein
MELKKKGTSEMELKQKGTCRNGIKKRKVHAELELKKERYLQKWN